MSCSTKASRSAGVSRVEHDEQREPDRVREERFLLGAASARARRDRLGRVRGQRLLAPRLARPQHVEAHARDDRRQPAAEVVDLLAIGAAEPQPRLLDRVVCLAQRAEHPVGHAAQMGSVLFESLGQIVAFVRRRAPVAWLAHCVRSHARNDGQVYQTAYCKDIEASHILSSRSVIPLTDERQTM